MLSERRERHLLREGIDPKQMEADADSYLLDLQKKGRTLKEAEIIIKIMARTLNISERYRPETMLSEIHLRKD